MPTFTQTGPRDKGVRMGRGTGPCGSGMRRQGNRAGRGIGRLFGGTRFSPMPRPASPDTERTWLTEEAGALERALADVRKRLDALNKTE